MRKGQVRHSGSSLSDSKSYALASVPPLKGHSSTSLCSYTHQSLARLLNTGWLGRGLEQDLQRLLDAGQSDTVMAKHKKVTRV